MRYPEVPILFVETRPLAEEWTYRWLGAALAESIATTEAWGDVEVTEEPSASSPDAND